MCVCVCVCVCVRVCVCIIEKISRNKGEKLIFSLSKIYLACDDKSNLRSSEDMFTSQLLSEILFYRHRRFWPKNAFFTFSFSSAEQSECDKCFGQNGKVPSC